MSHFALSTKIDDDDWESLFSICWKAFQDPEIRNMYPGGLENHARNAMGFKMIATSGPVEGYMAKLTENESNTITSYVAGKIYDGPLGNIDGDLAKPPPPVKLPFIGDPVEREWCEWYWGTGMSLMKEIKEMQVPHVYIQALATDPIWQRHGAATKLMNWVLGELAPSKQIKRCVLTASPLALEAGFYEKFGFRVVYTHEFVDEERFPGRVGPPLIVMVKDL